MLRFLYLSVRGEVRGELNARCPQPTSGESPLDPNYMNTSLEYLSIASYFRFVESNKKVRSYPCLVNFIQKSELSLSLGVLEPLYTFEIYAYTLSPSSLRKGY